MLKSGQVLDGEAVREVVDNSYVSRMASLTETLPAAVTLFGLRR